MFVWFLFHYMCFARVSYLAVAILARPIKISSVVNDGLHIFSGRTTDVIEFTMFCNRLLNYACVRLFTSIASWFGLILNMLRRRARQTSIIGRESRGCRRCSISALCRKTTEAVAALPTSAPPWRRPHCCWQLDPQFLLCANCATRPQRSKFFWFLARAFAEIHLPPSKAVNFGTPPTPSGNWFKCQQEPIDLFPEVLGLSDFLTFGISILIFSPSPYPLPFVAAFP